ncbi:MAG: TonB-dependent receptor, partial [Longimicrobiales bacterium]|nr:TonB-dependent receptor [Longimicrobiales bacterium]
MSQRTYRHGVLVVVAALFCIPATTAAQEAAIQGIVAEAGTGRPLEGVAVALEGGGELAYGTFTDRNGFYQIPGISPGTYTVRSDRIGYAQHEQVVTLAAGERQTVSFRLEPAAVALEGIVVAPDRGAAVRDLGRQVVTPKDMRFVPVPGGSGDLATYLQTLPGVTTTGDRGGQLFVRGGTPADNLVLVDGIPIYQPFHILGFFSVFPENLVSSADFYPGGFGARYHGRTSSVLDVRMRDGDPSGVHAMASVSPFLAEALVEGSVEGATWIASVRRSLVDETSGVLLGTPQPLTFESQLFKLTSTHRNDDRCSFLALRTADSGRLDPQEKESHVAWHNLLFGLRCVSLRPGGQLLEVLWDYTESGGAAVSRGSSSLSSSIRRVQHDLQATGTVGSIPVQAGYELYVESMTYDLTELFRARGTGHDAIFGASVYIEPDLALGSHVEVRPGVVLVAAPRAGVEPRLRASWEPFGPSGGTLQGALGLYRQNVVGTSDMRDVGSVFMAWMNAPDGVPQEAFHGVLGWQQTLGNDLRWSLDGYYKKMKGIPVPIWRAVAQFTTDLGRADGEAYGADVRVEYTTPRFYGFLGYGYSWTLYEASQAEFSTWFGEPVQSYHPPHDRRHQLNAI